jgi:hypothetical protein
MAKKEKNTGKAYEKLIAEIYKQLSPQAVVTFDDRIMGESGIVRKIDVSIRQKIADVDILIIIDAKDHDKKPAGAPELEKIVGDVKDVRADKGILICNKGFTRLAIKRAYTERITLLTAHSSANHNWKTEIKIPAISRRTSVQFTHSYKYTANGPQIILIKKMPDVIVEDGSTKPLYRHFIDKWLADGISKEEGRHKYEFQLAPPIINGSRNIKVDSEAWYEIKRKLYFKYITPTEYVGYKNYGNEEFVATSLTISDSVKSLDDDSWKEIKDENQIPAAKVTMNLEILEAVGQFKFYNISISPL